ncbi:hypothetical protein C8A00DRAFT_36582 [Chaetomidium leptoderma]|uniref:Uncharacterized protein n=1 Tax=Chaetomidium leptoderma TaxID=669021 RepID=A0AAN6VGD7_9PEZI|nr:hypothetical protein C8A00DRAFT_36582 [Chaetomidium leptoderma]
MARPRFPAPYAILHLGLRFISVGLCIATLASASYASSRAGYGTGLVGAFIASIFAMLVDLAEISALTDPARVVRRCSEHAMVYLEMLTVAICGVLPVMVVLAYQSLQHPGCGPHRPENECEDERRRRGEVQVYVTLAWILPEALA